MPIEKTIGSEGYYKTLALGAVAQFADAGGDLIQVDKSYFARQGVPGSVIPDFASAPASIKDQVSNPNLLPLGPAATTLARENAAGIASDGTAVIVSGISVTNIYLHRAGEEGYELVAEGLPAYSTADTEGIVETDNAGNWIIAKNGYLYLSHDNGETWAVNRLNQVADAHYDLMWADNGTILAIFGFASAQFIYRSTDAGRSWAQVNSFNNVGTVFYAGSDTWYVIRESTTTIYKSTDDGVTFSADVTLPFTPNADGNLMIGRASGSNFYILNSSVIYGGNDLTTLSNIGSSVYGLGVDGLGNAVALQATTGRIQRSANAGSLTNTDACTLGISASSRYYVQFANGVWIERNGGMITDADLVAGSKTLTDWSRWQAAAAKSGDWDQTNGVTIVALNPNSYVRTTDGFATWTLHNFDIVCTNFTAAVAVAGVACDQNGSWVVTLEGEEYFYHSTDGGLTWVERTIGSGVLAGCAGGEAAGVFLLLADDATGNGWFTDDNFATSAEKVGTGTAQTTWQPIYYDGFFYWINGAGTTYYITRLRVSDGVASNTTLVNNINVGERPAIQSAGQIAVDSWYFKGFNGLTLSSPIEVDFGPAIYSFIDGEPNTLPELGSTKRYEVASGIYASYGLDTTYPFFEQGVAEDSFTLQPNEYVKVAQL